MSIKDFVYRLSQKIQAAHNLKISRSHLYEIIALNQGYKSYNSFVAKNLILSVSYNEESEQDYEHELISALTLDILNNPPKTDYSKYHEDTIDWNNYEGYEFLEEIKLIIFRLRQLLKNDLPEIKYLEITKILCFELKKLNLNYLNFSSLRKRLSYVDYENGLIEDHEFEDEIYLLDDDFDNQGIISFSEISDNIGKIKHYAQEENNMDAYAILSKYYYYLANKIAPYGASGSNFGAVWDNKKMKYIETEKSQLNRKKYDEFIKEADRCNQIIKFSPINMDEIDFNRDDEIVYQQLIYLCNQGDLEAIEYLLYERKFKNSGEAWIYIYLAQFLKVDYTEDDLRAYNAYTGELYDDYGPMEIAGREAIQHVVELVALDTEKELLARKIAQELFDKI